MIDRKILLVQNIIAPYRIPVYNHIARKIKKFKVIFLAATHSNRQWDYSERDFAFDYEILRGASFFIQKFNWGLHFNLNIFRKLMKEDPDIVILTGYVSVADWLALLYCKMFKKASVLWSGSTLQSTRITKGPIHLLKKMFIRSVDAYLAYGSLAKEYLEFYGAQPEQIVTGCNTVDIRGFHEKIFALRGTLPSDATKTFICIGQLIERKGIKELLEAFSLIGRDDYKLLIVGDGPLKGELAAQAHLKKLPRVEFVGHKNYAELAHLMACADVLIMPSLTEVWGLVVNEALAGGLFVLASKYAGATRDLIIEGLNGFPIDPRDIHGMARSIGRCFDLKPDREAISKTIEKFTPEFYGECVLQAVSKTR